MADLLLGKHPPEEKKIRKELHDRIFVSKSETSWEVLLEKEASARVPASERFLKDGEKIQSLHVSDDLASSVLPDMMGDVIKTGDCCAARKAH